MASVIDDSLRRFLRWWGNELLGLLPGPLRRLIAPPGTSLDVLIGRETVEVREEHDGVSRSVGSFGSAGVDAALRAQVARLGRSSGAVVVRLPEERVLDTEIALPAAATDQLHEVIGLEIDRVTPFTAAEVVFDDRVVDSDLETEQIMVRLRIARRADIEAALAAAAALGLVPTRIDGPGGDAFNLLPEEARPRRSRALAGLASAAAVIVVGLGAATLWLSFARQAETLALLEERAAHLQTRAVQVRSVEDEADALLTRAQVIAAEKAAHPLVSVLVAEIAARSPDGSWFTDIALREDGALRLSGRSDASSDLLRRLGESPLLDGLRFAAPLVADTIEGGERFTIEARVRHGEAGPAP